MRTPVEAQKLCEYHIHLIVVLDNKMVHYSVQGVTGGTDQTSGECSLGQTIPI